MGQKQHYKKRAGWQGFVVEKAQKGKVPRPRRKGQPRESREGPFGVRQRLDTMERNLVLEGGGAGDKGGRQGKMTGISQKRNEE